MKIDELFPLQYLINLDERKDRLQLAEKEFAKIGISPMRFSAIKNENPALGCFQSHLEILKIAREKNQNVLIFEDDIEFIKGAKEIIESSLSDLNTGYWDLWYGSGNILKPAYQISKHLARLTHCQSTHFYSCHKDFLDTLISFLENNIYIIDVLYSQIIIPNNKCYISVPMAGIQRTDFSTIENQIMSYDIPVARFNQFLVRKEGL
jgi:GR25 family glycosyltransferase involved in LPS biosynthesis